MIDPNELQRTSGCGVQGCLFAAVALFVLLLVALLVIAVMRFSQPPAGPGMPQRGAGAGARGYAPVHLAATLPAGVHLGR